MSATSNNRITVDVPNVTGFTHIYTDHPELDSNQRYQDPLLQNPNWSHDRILVPTNTGFSEIALEQDTANELLSPLELKPNVAFAVCETQCHDTKKIYESYVPLTCYPLNGLECVCGKQDLQVTRIKSVHEPKKTSIYATPLGEIPDEPSR